MDQRGLIVFARRDEMRQSLTKLGTRIRYSRSLADPFKYARSPIYKFSSGDLAVAVVANVEVGIWPVGVARKSTMTR